MPAMAEETELRKVPRDPAEPRDSDAPAASQLAAPSDVNSSNGSRSCASSSDKQRRTEACNKLSESPVSPCFEDIDDSGQHERHTHGQLQSEKQGDSSVPFREHQSGIRTDAQPENGVEVTPPFCREETEGFFSVGGRTTDSANDDGHSSGSCSPCFPVSPSGSSYATRFPSGPHADVRALASCMVISETWTSSDGTGRRQEADRGERVLTAGACVQTALPSSGKEKVEEKALLRRTTSGVRGNIPLSPGYDGLQDARSSNSGGHSFRPQRVFEGRGGKQQPGLTKSQHGEIVPPPREEDIRGMHARRAMMETMLKAEDEKGMAKGKQREELLRRLLMEPKLEMFPVHVDRNLVTSWYYGTPSFSPAQTVEPDPNMPTAEARCKTESTENNACTSDTCSEEKGHSPRPLLTEGKASHGIRERGEGGVSRRPSIGKQLSQTSEEVTDAERYADEPQKSQFKTSESSCGARFGVMPFTRGGRETKAGLRVRASTEAKRFLSGAFCEPDAVEALWSKKTRLDSIFDGEMDWLYRAARDSIFPRDGYSRKHFNRAGDKIEEICDALFFYEGRPHSDDCLLNGDDTCSSNSRPTPNCENTDGSAADPTSSRQGVDEEGSSIVDQRGASYGIRQGGSRSSGKDVEELRGQRRVENHWRRLGILLGEPLTGGVRCVEAQDSISEGDRRREEGKTAWEHGDDEKEDGDERNVTNQHGDRETAIGERRQRFCTNTHRFFVDVCGGPGAWSLFLLAQPSHNVQRGTPTDSASYGSIRPEKSYSSEEGSSAGDTPQNGTEASHVGLGESRGEHRERLRSSSDSRSTQDCSPSEAAAERRREGNILLQGDGTRREGYVVCGFGMTLASGAAEKNGHNDRTIWYPQLLRHPRWNAVWGEDGTGNVYRLKNLSHSKRMISKMISQRLESLAGGEGKCRQGGKKQEVKEKIGQAASDRREEDLETKMNDEGEESSGTPEAANVVRGRSSSSSRSPSDFKREMDDMTGSLSSEQTTEIACGEMEKEFSPIHSASSPVDSDGLSPSGGHQHHNQGVPDGRHSTRNSNLLLKTQCTLSTAASTEGDSIADTSPSKSSLSHLGGPNVPTSSHSGVDDTREEEKENDENCVRTTERKVRREEQMLSCGDGVTSPAGQPGADVNTKQEEEEGDEEYSGVQHVALVVADGGFHLALRAMNPPIDEKTGRHIENFQELLCARLLLSELLFALMLLEERGTFICKIFDTFTHFTASLIYVVGRLFEECFIIKPTGSRAANSERYLVGLRLRSRKSTEFKQLFDVVRGVHAMWERGEQDGGKLAEDESPESLLPVEVLRSDVRFVESLGAACRFLCLKQSLALDMVCRKYAELKENPAEFSSLLKSSSYAYHVTSRVYSSHYAGLPPSSGKQTGPKITHKGYSDSQSNEQAGDSERSFLAHHRHPGKHHVPRQPPQRVSHSSYSGEPAHRQSDHSSHSVGWPSKRAPPVRGTRREAEGPYPHVSRGKGAGNEPTIPHTRRRQRGGKEKYNDPLSFLESWEVSPEGSNETRNPPQVIRLTQETHMGNLALTAREEGGPTHFSHIAGAAQDRDTGNDFGQGKAVPKRRSEGSSNGLALEQQEGGERGFRLKPGDGEGVSSSEGEKQQMVSDQAHMQQLQAQHEQRLLQRDAARGGNQRLRGRGHRVGAGGNRCDSLHFSNSSTSTSTVSSMLSAPDSSAVRQSAHAIFSLKGPAGATSQLGGPGRDSVPIPGVSPLGHLPPSALSQLHKEMFSGSHSRAFVPGVFPGSGGPALSGRESAQNLSSGGQDAAGAKAGTNGTTDGTIRTQSSASGPAPGGFQADGVSCISQHPQWLLEKLRELQLQKQTVAEVTRRQQGAGNHAPASNALQGPSREHASGPTSLFGNLRDPRQTLSTLVQLNQWNPASVATLLTVLAGMGTGVKASESSSTPLPSPAAGTPGTTHTNNLHSAGGVGVSLLQAALPQARGSATLHHQNPQRHPQLQLRQSQRSPADADPKGEARGVLSRGCDTADVAALAARIVAQHRASLAGGAGAPSSAAGRQAGLPTPRSGPLAGGNGSGPASGDPATGWLQGGSGTIQQQELTRLRLRQFQALQESQKHLQRLLLQRQQGGGGSASIAAGMDLSGPGGYPETQMNSGLSSADSSARSVLSSVSAKAGRSSGMCGGGEAEASGSCSYAPSATARPAERVGVNGSVGKTFGVGKVDTDVTPPFLGGSALPIAGLGVSARPGEKVSLPGAAELIQHFQQATRGSNGGQGNNAKIPAGSSSMSSTPTSAAPGPTSCPSPSRGDIIPGSPRAADLLSSGVSPSVRSLAGGGGQSDNTREAADLELRSPRNTRPGATEGPGGGGQGPLRSGPADRGSRQHYNRGGRGGGIGRRGAGRRGGGPGGKHRGGIWDMMDDNIMDVSTWSL